MSRGSSRGSSHRSSSTTIPTPRVRLLRHVTRLVALLIVDYFASHRLAVDYFAYVAHPGASARRAARHAAHRRLHRLRRASGCLGTPRGSSRDSSRRSSLTTPPTPRVRVPRHVVWLISPLVIDYFTSRRLVVDYFAYAARPGASAHHAARRRLLRAPRLPLAATLALLQPRCASRLLVSHPHWLYFDYAARPGASAHRVACRAARRQLLRLRRASGFLSTSRGSLSTSSHMSCIRVPRHVARLVVDYFAYATHPGASACCAAHHAARRRLLRASRLLVLQQHWLCFEYATRCCDVVFRSHRVDHSSQLVFETS
jgi:hypothetical protein